MEARDTIRISFDQNPAVAEFVRDKLLKAGEKVEMEFTGTLKSVDEEGIDIEVAAYVPEGYEVNEDTEPGQVNMPAGGPVSNEPSISPAAMVVKRQKKV